jgi:hypothetical protein
LEQIGQSDRPLRRIFEKAARRKVRPPQLVANRHLAGLPSLVRCTPLPRSLTGELIVEPWQSRADISVLGILRAQLRYAPPPSDHISVWRRCAFLAASVGGLCDPSSAAAFLARRRIDFATRSHRLHNYRITGAIACRTFLLGRFSGGLSHLSRLSRLRPLSGPALGIVKGQRGPVVPP